MPMFITVDTDMYWRIVYDRDTLVMYAVSEGRENRGVFTLLVNPDGSPKLYKEDV